MALFEADSAYLRGYQTRCRETNLKTLCGLLKTKFEVAASTNGSFLVIADSQDLTPDGVELGAGATTATRLGISNEADVHLRGGRIGGLADHHRGAADSGVGAEAGVARGDSGVEHSAHSEAGLLSASGTGAEADLLDASPLCARLRQARDG